MNIEELSKRVDQLEFREGLILKNSEVSRILL